MCFLWCHYCKKLLLRLGYRRLWLPSSCHPHSFTLSDEGICHIVSCPMERSAWQGTDQQLMKNQTLLIITCVNLGASSGKPEIVAVLIGTLIGALWETQSQRKQPSFTGKVTHQSQAAGTLGIPVEVVGHDSGRNSCRIAEKRNKKLRV